MRVRFVSPISPTVALFVVAMAGCTSSSTQREGRFELHSVREDALGHSLTRISLRFGRRVLASELSDWTVDSHHPDRIVFAARVPCGTFFFDGSRGDTVRLADRQIVVHDASRDTPSLAGSTPWSPDGRYVWIDDDIASPSVIDLGTLRRIDLAGAVSSDGRRLSMNALLWSADSRRIAAILQPGGYNDPDRDLVAVSVDPLNAEYVATMTDRTGRGLTLWTVDDFHWDGNHLVVEPTGKNGPIIVRDARDRRWSPTTPTQAAEQMERECP